MLPNARMGMYINQDYGNRGSSLAQRVSAAAYNESFESLANRLSSSLCSEGKLKGRLDFRVAVLEHPLFFLML